MEIYGKRVRFSCRGPWEKGRASFSILQDEIDTDGSRSQTRVRDPRIDALNNRYTAGRIGLVDARIVLDQIKQEFVAKWATMRRDRPIASFNQEILDDFVREKIIIKTAAKKSTIDADTARAVRAVRLLGNHRLRTVDIGFIQNILDSQKTKNSNSSMLLTFRRLLRFVGRVDESESLRPKAFQYVKPPHLSPAEVIRLADLVDDEIRKTHPIMREFVLILFLFGLRISEALGVKKEDVGRTKAGNRAVMIRRQYVRKQQARSEDDRLRETKNRKERTVSPLNPDLAWKCLAAWLKAYPEPQQREPYRFAADRFIRTNARKLFQKELGSVDFDDFFDAEDPDLPVIDDDRKLKAAHMLRASHAVELMRLTGGNYDLVAKQLGDNPEVIRKHYSDEVSVGNEVDLVAAAIKGVK